MPSRRMLTNRHGLPGRALLLSLWPIIYQTSEGAAASKVRFRSLSLIASSTLLSPSASAFFLALATHRQSPAQYSLRARPSLGVFSPNLERRTPSAACTPSPRHLCLTHSGPSSVPAGHPDFFSRVPYHHRTQLHSIQKLHQPLPHSPIQPPTLLVLRFHPAEPFLALDLTFCRFMLPFARRTQILAQPNSLPPPRSFFCWSVFCLSFFFFSPLQNPTPRLFLPTHASNGHLGGPVVWPRLMPCFQNTSIGCWCPSVGYCRTARRIFALSVFRTLHTPSSRRESRSPPFALALDPAIFRAAFKLANGCVQEPKFDSLRSHRWL